MASGPKRKHPAIRVLSLLASTPDDPDACWETTARNTARPMIGVGRETVRTARVVLEASLGRELGAGMCALHTCDNPRCVRPEHLFEGTRQDNMRDMAAKERGNTVKLTATQRAEVVWLAREGWVKTTSPARTGSHRPASGNSPQRPEAEALARVTGARAVASS